MRSNFSVCVNLINEGSNFLSDKIKLIAVIIMIVSVSACANKPVYQDDTSSIRKELSIEAFERKQQVTNLTGETMVQICLKRVHPEIGNLWHCKSTVVSAENNSHTESDLYPIKNVALLSLVSNEYNKVEGEVFGELFMVEVDNVANQLTFKMSLPLNKNVLSQSNNLYISTTVGVCSGTVNFSQKEEKNMLSEHCYYTYKKH
jgi:hypothetical protein